MKEEKIKQRKESMNYSKKAEEERCSSANSYTISNPVFPSHTLKALDNNNKDESDKETINDDALSINTEVNDDEKTKEYFTDDKPKESSSFEILQEPNLKNQMKFLIDKQKEEYLKTMDSLKRKFIVEQQQLFTKLQNKMQNMTSTPLNNSIALTEDEEFTEFQTCLQSFEKSSSEKTLISENNIKHRAATKINALVRGYLVRRLMKTIYVQEIIKSIQDTLNFVFSLSQHKLGGSPVQDMLLKTKLFKQLRADLHRFNEIFHQYTTHEKMRIIATDREFRRKRIAEKRLEYLNRSF